jgi:hypothetical protein
VLTIFSATSGYRLIRSSKVPRYLVLARFSDWTDLLKNCEKTPG